MDNLKGNEPHDDVKEMVNLRKEKQLKDMEEKTEDTFEINFDDFKGVIDTFVKKDTNIPCTSSVKEL